jgi:hypothetical protein
MDAKSRMVLAGAPPEKVRGISQSWLQPPFSGVPRPGRDALNRRQLQTNGLLKIKGLLELSLERRLAHERASTSN